MSNVATLPASGSAMTAQDEHMMSPVSMLNDSAAMERMIRFAEIMATGKATIPAELRNVGDCLAITMQAMNWKMNPFSVAQKTHFISGKIGYEAQLVAAAVNNSGAVKDNFHFEWFGPWEKVIGKFEIKRSDKGEYRVPGWKLADEEGIGIKVWATLRGEDEPRELILLLAQARTRNSTLWADDPRQQLAYLAQKRWARLYAPGVILGVYTPDELMEPAELDMGAAEVLDTRPASNSKTSALKDKLGAGKNNATGPVLADVLSAIEAAHDGATMAAAKAMGAQMPDGPDKDKAVAAYGRRVAALKAQAEQQTHADPQTGEILDSTAGELPFDEQDDDLRSVEQGETGVTLKEVTAALNNATSLDALYLAADLIKEVSDEKQREQLGAIYAKRKKQLGAD
ncbi:recombinase RecT [Azoarcus sp. L1K30]|uniref:RecT family recombinase n=1 Tax=Azoarcus sp. L1K30 TaxID=2820277 RepID=UPI001B82A1F4|nr:RecT family recombinase [Azoarcus sp. L1K30]MBR0568389.1 recombinase RecT [Azoarcus sp. L1K30]